MTRRQALRLLSHSPVLAGVWPLAGLPRNTSRDASPAALQRTQAHGLLFDDARLPAIQDLYVTHPFFAPLRSEIEEIDRDAERRFITSEVRLNDQLTDIGRVSSTAESMALHYLLTGDEDAATLASECVETLMRFKRWDFFLDGDQSIGVQRAPATTIAVALVSDWLGDRVSKSDRKRWITTMGERGCEACFRSLYGIRYPREVVGWRFDPESTILERRPGNFTDMNRRPEITQTTNLRAAPACGLVYGAAAHAAVLGKTLDYERWIEMGAHAVDAFGDIFEPDGSYDEGVSYANYTADQLTQAITVLERSTGQDLSQRVNWEGYIDYVTNMSMATTADPYEIVNFGDNGNAKTGEAGVVARTAVPFWVARTHGSERAQWFGNNLGGRADIRSLLFFDDAVQPAPPPSGNQYWECDLDWVVARTGFEADDLVVAMRSGRPANHEHADRNSIVVKCFGEQLVTDPYRPPYSFADPAWRMRLTEGHSAVLIDGRGHEHHNGVEGTNASQSHARIVRSNAGNESGGGHASWISDATQAYRLVDLRIALVRRYVMVSYEVPAVVVIDRVIKREDDSTMEARYFGFNWDDALELDVTGSSTFSIIRPGAVVKAVCYSNAGLQVERGQLPIPEERAVRHPFIRVATTTPTKEILLVTAMGIGRDARRAPVPEITSTGDTLSVQVNDFSLNLDAGALAALDD